VLIAQISDTHILAPTADHPSVALRAAWLRQCVAEINEQRPDVVIFTGDTVQTGQAEEYEYLRELLAPLTAPLYVVPGNRDDNRVLRTVLKGTASLPENTDILQYVVDAHAVRLIAIDSTDVGERKGVFGSERQSWLEAALSEKPQQSTILFIHHPPFDIGDHYIGGYRRQEEAVALTNIVQRHPQVKALLCGHVHRLVDRAWAGSRAIVMPSVAVDLRKEVDETIAKNRPIYMLHQLSDGLELSSESRIVSGG
jgi:3',5'-cyclic AMP phosphodiesterase CpdA